MTKHKGRSRGKRLHSVTFEGTYRQRLRRGKVFELRLRNYSIREMAAKLECSVGAIVRDLEAIDLALMSKLHPGQANRILNEKLGELESIKAMAFDALGRADGNTRVGLLNTALRSIEISTRLLQDAGVLPKATLKIGGPDGKPIPMVTNVKVEIIRATSTSPPVLYTSKTINVAAEMREREASAE